MTEQKQLNWLEKPRIKLNVGFNRERKTEVPREKPFGAEWRTNELNPHKESPEIPCGAVVEAACSNYTFCLEGNIDVLEDWTQMKLKRMPTYFFTLSPMEATMSKAFCTVWQMDVSAAIFSLKLFPLSYTMNKHSHSLIPITRHTLVFHPWLLLFLTEIDVS